MRTTTRKRFTETEKKLLHGLSGRLGQKHGCSGMYVRYIINGKRGTKSVLAQRIIKDLNALLNIFRKAGAGKD